MAARWNDDDVGKLVEQIRTCSGLGGFADRMAAIAALLESFLPYRELVTLMVDPETRALPDPQHVCAAKDDPARFNDYSTYYSRLDPTLPWLERNLGVPNLSSAFLPDSRFGRTEYTRDCLEAQRIRWILGAMSAMPDGWRMVYSIQRGRRDRDFTSTDLQLLQRLMPEIERVAFGALLSEKLSRLAGSSEASFEGSEVAEFTQAGDLLRATPRALALLGCGSADRAGVGDTLFDAVRSLTQAQGPCWHLERQWLTPDGSKVSATFVRPSSDGGHVVALLKHSPGPQLLRLELKRRFGLTPREAEVAELAARGLSNKEIGRELGTSAETVKIQLGRAMKKTGIGSRAGLAPLVARDLDANATDPAF